MSIQGIKEIKLLYLIFSFLLSTNLIAQKVTISGFIQDEKSGERLIYANIFEKKNSQGTISNAYSFYSLTIPKGSVEIFFSYVGYEAKVVNFELTKDTVINVKLNPSILLEEVVITGSAGERQHEQTQMSVHEIPVSSIKSLPYFLGEKDVLKVIQLFPGVQSGNEGTSGIYVRGGGSDQNLILLDGVPVYNVDHLFGFFSIFNPDALQHISLIKGGFPARYGGRLSSVLDIRMKEGNNKEFHGEASIGLISSKLTFEGPIIKEKSSFIVSARRTYIDLLVAPFIRAYGDGVSGGYYFYDFNTKFNYIISDKDRLFLSLYTGKDKFYAGFKESWHSDGNKYETQFRTGLDWGNITTALRWNHVFNSKTFVNTTATYSRYQFNVLGKFIDKQTVNNIVYEDIFSYNYLSGINDIALKSDFEYHHSPNHKILFGVSDIYHTFIPGSNVLKQSSSDLTDNIDTTFGNNRIYAHEISAYAEDEMSVGAKIKLNLGLHFSTFLVHGTYYYSLQPRLSSRYLFHEKWSVKFALSNMSQYILLLTNSGIGLPTDLWLPVTENIKPQNSWQYAAGVFYNLSPSIEVSFESFYKTMTNLIEYREGVEFMSISETWEDKVVSGNGEAYGAEILIRKDKGKTTGWIGYTLSWSNRQFDDLNFGNPFPYKYDRRHDASIVISHLINENTDIGLTFVYGTGNALSLPIEKYPQASSLEWYFYQPPIEYYEGRNLFRAPAYHRMDLGVNMHKERKRGKRTWSISVYNLYNRKNPFMLYFSNDEYGNTKLMQFSLFPIIPSVSYSFKF